MSKMTTISLRVTEDFRKAVEEIAKINDRDTSSEVKHRLKRTLIDDGILPAEEIKFIIEKVAI